MTTLDHLDEAEHNEPVWDYDGNSVWSLDLQALGVGPWTLKVEKRDDPSARFDPPSEDVPATWYWSCPPIMPVADQLYVDSLEDAQEKALIALLGHSEQDISDLQDLVDYIESTL